MISGVAFYVLLVIAQVVGVVAEPFLDPKDCDEARDTALRFLDTIAVSECVAVVVQPPFSAPQPQPVVPTPAPSPVYP